MGRCAVLQIRGQFDPVKMRPQSYPGGCQITASGTIEKEESIARALRHVIMEELGYNAFNIFAQSGLSEEYIASTAALMPVPVQVMTFAVALKRRLSESFLKLLRLGPASGGIRLVTEAMLPTIKNLREFPEDQGVTDRGTIAMFPDEAEAVRAAFQPTRS